jgi:uncharacterized membrane protein (DUF2068 family)
MSSEANVPAPAVAGATPALPLKRAPTLFVISLFKVVKGVLFLALGFIIYLQATQDLPGEVEGWLQKPVVRRLLIHPESKFIRHIADQIEEKTPNQVRSWGVGTMLFSLFPLVEGIGMLFRAGWAGWLAIGESAFFVPIEVYEMAKTFSWYMLVIMIINIIIVWYLYANRQTLFHHHHKHT